MNFIIGLVVLGVIITVAMFLGGIVINIVIMAVVGIFSGIVWIFNKVTGKA